MRFENIGSTLVLVSCMAVAVSVGAPACTAETSPEDPAEEPHVHRDFGDLFDKASSQRSIRVIVRTSADFIPWGDLSAEGKVEQAKSLSAAQQQLLAALERTTQRQARESLLSASGSSGNPVTTTRPSGHRWSSTCSPEGMSAKPYRSVRKWTS